MTEPLTDWIAATLGRPPRDPALYARALTHASRGDPSYERLEFLGDRVLGLAAADWLYRLYPDEPEGALSRRLNALVSGETCAGVAREIDVGPHLRLGKQARDDGGEESDNILGDTVEALIGALFLEHGLAAARGFIERAWGDRATGPAEAPRHPKSVLQEWAAAHRCKPPVYTLAGRAGPHHAPVFRVRVELPGRDAAEAEGSSKQDAETEAAKALLERLA